MSYLRVEFRLVTDRMEPPHRTIEMEWHAHDPLPAIGAFITLTVRRPTMDSNAGGVLFSTSEEDYFVGKVRSVRQRVTATQNNVKVHDVNVVHVVTMECQS